MRQNFHKCPARRRYLGMLDQLQWRLPLLSLMQSRLPMTMLNLNKPTHHKLSRRLQEVQMIPYGPQWWVTVCTTWIISAVTRGSETIIGNTTQP